MRSCLFGVCALLLVSSLTFAGPILIVNPGFETGDFTGWTRSGDLGFTWVSSGGAHSGTYKAEFGPVGSLGYIAQNIATTPGEAYDVTFWLRGTYTPNQVELDWGGAVAASWTNVNLPGWTVFSSSGLGASSSLTELKLGFRNDPDYLYVDDIAVNPTIPEPSTALLFAAGAAVLALRRWLF